MKKRLAIIGGGISGLTTAYLTHTTYDISLFESASRVGGHTATVDITYDGVPYTIDTGFIVFNEYTYPNFNRLLSMLGVEKQEAWMGFSVVNKDYNLEYNTSGLSGFFAQRKNILSLIHWRFLFEILRFNAQAKQISVTGAAPEDETLATFLKKNNYSKKFTESYIMPLTSIIWSQDQQSVLEVPLHFFVSFFRNHGLFSKADILRWFVVKNNSRSYIEPLSNSFKDRIYLEAKINKVKREETGVIIHFADGTQQFFDEVVFATHSDSAHNLLEESFKSERTVLSLIPYVEHSVTLHTDSSIMPKAPSAWESWNIESTIQSSTPIFTYWMNQLQSIVAPVQFFVSLDAGDRVAKGSILHSAKYSHPVFSVSSVSAQTKWQEINGINHVWFAGAYWRNGFHEDGVWSGIRVAKALGVDISEFEPFIE